MFLSISLYFKEMSLPTASTLTSPDFPEADEWPIVGPGYHAIQCAWCWRRDCSTLPPFLHPKYPLKVSHFLRIQQFCRQKNWSDSLASEAFCLAEILRFELSWLHIRPPGIEDSIEKISSAVSSDDESTSYSPAECLLLALWERMGWNKVAAALAFCFISPRSENAAFTKLIDLETELTANC